MSALLDYIQKQQSISCQLDAILEVLTNNQVKLDELDAMRLLHAALYLSGELVDGLDSVHLPKEGEA